MRKLLLFLFTLLLIQKSYSQELIVNTNKLWSIIDNYQVLFGGSPKCYFINFHDDTLISNIQFKKVWKSEDQSKSNWNNIGYIKEDTSHKVHFMNKTYKEGLLYDFDVAVGDTILITNPLLYLTEAIFARVSTITDTVINGNEA